jgi:hypothetical protein
MYRYLFNYFYYLTSVSGYLLTVTAGVHVDVGLPFPDP